MNRFIRGLIVASVLLLSGTASGQLIDFKKKVHPESSEEARVKQVETILEKNDGLILVYAKGLCCPSCAIGIRKMVSRLDFVDSSGKNKGVELDPEFQLVSFRLQKDNPIDLGKLALAIDDAGYEPVQWYRMKDSKVLAEKLSLNEKASE